MIRKLNSLIRKANYVAFWIKCFWLAAWADLAPKFQYARKDASRFAASLGSPNSVSLKMRNWTPEQKKAYILLHLPFTYPRMVWRRLFSLGD